MGSVQELSAMAGAASDTLHSRAEADLELAGFEGGRAESGRGLWDLPGLNPWDVPDPSYGSEARLEAERMRSRELEERALSLREEIAGYQSRQDQILEKLADKDKEIIARDRAIDDLRSRLEELERRMSSPAPVSIVQAPVPAAPLQAAPPPPAAPPPAVAPALGPAPAAGPDLSWMPAAAKAAPAAAPAPVENDPRIVLAAPASAVDDPRIVAPAPTPAAAVPPPLPEAHPPAPIPAPAPAPAPAPGGTGRAFTVDELLAGATGAAGAMGFEAPRAEPLKSAASLPETAFVPPTPQPAQEPPAPGGGAPVFLAGSGPEAAREPMTMAVNPAPGSAPEAAKPAEIRLLSPEAPVSALGPDAPPPGFLEAPPGAAPAEPAPTGRVEQPRTMVFGGQTPAQPALEPESLISLAPFASAGTPPGGFESQAAPLTPVGPASGDQFAAPELPSSVLQGLSRGKTPLGRRGTDAGLRFERSPEEPPSERPSAPPQRKSQKVLLSVLAVGGVCTVALLFLFLRNPKKTAEVMMGSPRKGKGLAAAPGSDEPATAGPFSAGPARQAAPAVPAGAAPLAAPMTPPPAAPAPTQPTDFIENNNVKAMELVKQYPLGQAKGSIAQWLKYSFSSPDAQETWTSGALSANVYLVYDKVTKVGQAARNAKPIANYGFEVDVVAGSIKGTTPEARDLLASNGVAQPPAAAAAPAAPAAEAQPAPAPVRRPQPRRAVRSRTRRKTRASSRNSQLPLPEDDDPSGGSSGFNNPGSGALEMNP